jgi:hypothetical protein
MGAVHNLFQCAAFFRWIFPRDDDLPRPFIFFQLPFKLCQPDKIRQCHLHILQVQPFFNADEQFGNSLSTRVLRPALRLFWQRLPPTQCPGRHLSSTKKGRSFLRSAPKQLSPAPTLSTVFPQHGNTVPKCLKTHHRFYILFCHHSDRPTSGAEASSLAKYHLDICAFPFCSHSS